MLSLGGERHRVRTYPTLFDDFNYGSAAWGQGIFGANRWAHCDEVRTHRAWHRFSVGAQRTQWNPRSVATADASGRGTLSLVMPRGYTGNASWADRLTFNPAIQLDLPVGTGTYAARIHFSPLERGTSVDQAFFLFNHDTHEELDFEWTNAPGFCGGSVALCRDGLMFVTNHDGPGSQDGAHALFCRGRDPCVGELTRDFVILLMDYSAARVRYEVHGRSASGTPLRWGPRVLDRAVPGGPMLIWIGNGIQSASTVTLAREHRLRVDWVYHTPVDDLTVADVTREVERFRRLGLSRVHTLPD
jgi:hypothetical protein